MKASDFGSFYAALYNREPFPWQIRLTQQVIEKGIWPKLLDLPTGSGKTSILDIAIFALACTTDSPERQMPRRIFYLVDRRIIVDSTFEHSKHIANELRKALRGEGILRDVAESLQQLSRHDDVEVESEPLHVSMLRGGMYREDAWARSPVQPTICVSTVDQIGSRLLFRGYGVNESSWPIHAGLVGSDSLLILDEAHISRPFSQTLSLIQHYCGPDWSEQSLGKTFSVVKMTATPDQVHKEEIESFGLGDEDGNNETLSLRLNASKIAVLEEVTDSDDGNKQAAFVHKLRSIAYELAWPSLAEIPKAKPEKRTKKQQGEAFEDYFSPARVIGIVVNRVATARNVFELIKDDADRRKCDVILLTGRARPYDRDVLLYNLAVDGVPGGWLRYIKADKDRPKFDWPLFVVATQTVEVGADLDFDALVTEIAPLDVLQQRFGRVDRLGIQQKSRSYVVARSSSIARDADDWLYGETLKTTWKLLSQIAKRKTVDFGITHLRTALHELDTEQLRCALSPGLEAPVLLPVHVDALSQTSPAPAAEPDIGLLLHGKKRSAEAYIIWRAALPYPLEFKNANSIIKSLEFLPPTSIEALALPFPAAKRWLESRALSRSFTDQQMADVEGGAPEAEKDHISAEQFVGIRWHGIERSQLIRASELRPGDTVVVPQSFGGVDLFGWNPDSHENVRDISEVCNRIVRRELVLRIPRSGALSWTAENDEDEIHERVETLRAALQTAQDADSVQEAAESIVDFLHSTRLQPWVGDLSDVEASELSIFRHPLDGWLFTIDREFTVYNPAFEPGNYDKFGGEDDSPSLQRSRNRIPLNSHLQAVGNELRFWCSKLRLNDVGETLCLAGDLHDVGKADPRFQSYLHGGNEVAGFRLQEPLAKSGNAYLGREENKRARERAGLPSGFRHEALSLAMIANNSVLPSVDRDLLLHLIGTHHGYGRPLLPPVEDSVNEEVRYEFRSAVMSAAPNHNLHRPDQGVPDRFWRMTHRFGWWGCAYLEGLLRLADRRVSEREQLKRYAAQEINTNPIVLNENRGSSSHVAEPSVTLIGINGESPLGFLTSLGVFRLLSHTSHHHETRLSWFWDGNWRPRIHGFQTSVELLHSLLEALNSDQLSVAAFLKRHLTDYENLTIPAADFHNLLLTLASQSTIGERFVSNCHACLGSDAYPTQKGQISDTALRTLSGAGHQDFLGSMRGLAEAVHQEHLEAALFSPWKYLEGWESLRWDPQEDRRYALRAQSPSGEKTQSVPGANRLAFEALPLFPTFASSRHVVTRAFSGRGPRTVFSWPIWSNPISLNALEVLLSHRELVQEIPDESKLRPLGIEEVLRASRITVGHFRNFTPSRACWGASLAVEAGQ